MAEFDRIVMAGATGESPVLTEDKCMGLIETDKAEARQITVFVAVRS
jgi:dihydrodipicolinate synthase/N-acetylneuraminate lyase